MPRCEECGEWFLTKRKLNWHYDEEHFFPKRNKCCEGKKDENSLISSGIPYFPIVADREEKLSGGGGEFSGGSGEFSGGGASGDWGGDTGNDADCNSCSDSCDCSSSDD